VKSTSTKREASKRLSAYEAALKAGIIGCIDGPPDLARNRRKYLRRALRAKSEKAGC
jgi:predicted metal-dependent phosphotriesterase family hydrolase